MTRSCATSWCAYEESYEERLTWAAPMTLDRSDCSNRRKIIDVWRKRCAMRLAQVLVNAVGSRRGSCRNQTNPCPELTRKRGVRCRIGYFSHLDGRQLFCCQCVCAHFQHGFITKGDGIKYVVRNGTDTFYIFCLPNQRRCGTSVPIGFGPWGNFRMAWGNPVCHWDGVNSGCLG